MSYYNKVDRTMTQFTKLCLHVQGYTALHAVITSYESALFLSLKNLSILTFVHAVAKFFWN